jgi:hypothetical protein
MQLLRGKVIAPCTAEGTHASCRWKGPRRFFTFGEQSSSRDDLLAENL